MRISDIKIRSTENSGRMLAVVSVTFDDQLALHDIKIVEANEKRFLAMPSKKLPDGRFKDVAHPISEEFRNLLEASVMEKYEEYQKSMTDGEENGLQ